MRAMDERAVPRRILQEFLLLLCRYQLLGRAGYALLKLLTVEIPRSVTQVSGIQLPHGAAGLVVHPTTKVLGSVKLFQGVTIGRADNYLAATPTSDAGVPGGVVIEDGVQISAGAKILFRTGQTLTIGRNSVIGANAVVLTSVLEGEIWASLPAKKIGKRMLESVNSLLP